MKPRNGRYTVAALSRQMIEAGLGLSESEIERFYARVDMARNRQLRPPVGPAHEFRVLIERNRDLLGSRRPTSHLPDRGHNR